MARKVSLCNCTQPDVAHRRGEGRAPPIIAVGTRRLCGEPNAPAAFTPRKSSPNGTHLERRLIGPQIDIDP